jgi:hypothetical protein
MSIGATTRSSREQEQSMDSMSTVLTIFGVLVSLTIVGASMLSARKMISGMLSPLLAQQAETRRLLTVGIPCAARVIDIDQTGTSVAMMGEQSYELRFQLEVAPPAPAVYRGMSAPYRAEMVSLVPMLMLPRVQPGCVIAVRVDPHDPRKMAFESATPPVQAGYPGASAAYPAPAMGGYPGPMVPHGQAPGQAHAPPGVQQASGAPPAHGGYTGGGAWNPGGQW